jgi:hypothetical protein
MNILIPKILNYVSHKNIPKLPFLVQKENSKKQFWRDSIIGLYRPLGEYVEIFSKNLTA